MTDPHSFFIRIAAELGIPAAILIGLLIALADHARRHVALPMGRAAFNESAAAGIGDRWPHALVLCVAWWVLGHLFIAEEPNVLHSSADADFT